MLAHLVSALLAAGVQAAPFPEPGARDLLVDVGVRRVHEEHLGYGWSRPERYRQRTYAWIKRLEGDTWFTWPVSEDLDFWIRAAPLYLKDRHQNVGLYLNGVFVEEWVYPSEDAYVDRRVRLPGRHVKAGRNRITLRMGYCRRVGQDRRTLSLNVDKMLVRPAEP